MSAAKSEGPLIFGLMAEFSDPDELVQKAHQAYEAGYRKMDAYTPFPVHGLPTALGFKWNWVPFIVGAAAIMGGIGGFLLQYWVSVIAYPVNIAGRPLNTWPAFMVVTFEMTILSAGGPRFLGMILLNKLPQPYHPVFNVPRFEMASSDKFFLCIMKSDPKFDMVKTRDFLEGLEPEGVYEVDQDDDNVYD